MLFFHKQSYLKIRKLLQPSLIFKILYQFFKTKNYVHRVVIKYVIACMSNYYYYNWESYEYIYM